MIKQFNEEHEFYCEQEYTEPIEVWCVDVYITVQDNNTNEIYDTVFDINNNKQLNPYEFFDYVAFILNSEIEDVEDDMNVTVLSINEFKITDTVHDNPVYCKKVDDLYDIFG